MIHEDSVGAEDEDDNEGNDGHQLRPHDEYIEMKQVGSKLKKRVEFDGDDHHHNHQNQHAIDEKRRTQDTDLTKVTAFTH